ncbi:GNAT family N-acetyltransferase [Fluviicola sp.]|jgi:L-amino acid N-acyltransferase YncA|uniref:GNAT family N-acetyltransferase n=1 Tax=Fluviicola sp. TaxID=1917219 RepID=UPI002833ADB4|nr:GNAT family N-acetyltransferase [Fluviicola sp.]MDR0802195.1 GNAT family N-acetyltransferase [Fluviicola sp.]
MKIKSIDGREKFQQISKEFSAMLYDPYPNLQCNETIDKNFDKGFVLYANNEIAATACVIKNPDLFFNNENAVCLAFYECVENAEASKMLLQTIAEYCQQQGYKYLIGPFNGSTWNSYRFALEPITDSYFGEPFHKHYYAEQFKNFGFQTAAEYVTQINTALVLPDTPTILNETFLFRTLDINNYETEMKNIFSFCKEIFHNNFLYTEIGEEIFLSKYIALKNIIHPELVLIAEDNGEIVGLILALHDFYCKHEKRMIIKTLGRKSDARYAGLAYELSRRIIKIAIENKYQTVLHAFMHQNNASVKMSNKFSGKPFRKYKLFYKEL